MPNIIFIGTKMHKYYIIVYIIALRIECMFKLLLSIKCTFIAFLGYFEGKIVIFGAGHRAVMFINLLQIADVISAVIDDDERKQGLFIPGTRVPIESSSYLGDNTVGSCIFAIGIDAEKKLAELFSSRFDHPLQYYSISPDSSLALPIFQ